MEHLSQKIILYPEASQKIQEIKEEGNKIVQCHGTFDLIHPGHIIHLQEAKDQGDILVVTFTEEKFVNKGPGRPFFNDQLRALSLAAIEVVDFVIPIPYPAAVEAITCVKPDIYCKGKEYEDTSVDVTGNIHDDLTTVEKYGGKVEYIGSVVFSSTKLLNNHFAVHSDEVTGYCKELASNTSTSEIKETVDRFSELKVLVLGEIILDKYSTTSVQGLTSKNRIISSRFIDEEIQAGGALAVYRHIQQFTDNVQLMSLIGGESWTDDVLSPFIQQHENFIYKSDEYSTIVKQRFIEPQIEGKELSKLFSVNYIQGDEPSDEVLKPIEEKLKEIIKDYDLVLVMDFGHGLLSEGIRKLVQKEARFLAVNCQTNSNNFGFNIISHRYQRADSCSLDETEIKLFSGKKNINFQEQTQNLRDHLDAKCLWLTRGGNQTIGVDAKHNIHLCPSFQQEVVDTIGAGDAFCSVASLAAAQGTPLSISTFLGQLAGSQAVLTVGNRHPISKAKLLKACSSLLSF
jgi:cytidyltransferase-like protein